MSNNAKTEIWVVTWAEFDGWEYELYTGFNLFKTKEDAIAWVEDDYNTTLADQFDQNPDEDPDDHPELTVDPGSIEDSFTVDFPKAENYYRTWTISKKTI